MLYLAYLLPGMTSLGQRGGFPGSLADWNLGSKSSCLSTPLPPAGLCLRLGPLVPADVRSHPPGLAGSRTARERIKAMIIQGDGGGNSGATPALGHTGYRAIAPDVLIVITRGGGRRLACR